MSDPSVRPPGTTRLTLEGFSWNLICEGFRKICREYSSFIKTNKNNGCITWPINIFWSHLANFLSEREMFQTNIVKKIKTHILCSVTFIFKSYFLWDNVEKFCRTGQATDDNMAHAHCMPGTYDYKYTHSGCVIFIAFLLQQWLQERASVLRYM
jgi:hypothetical protein